MEVIIDHQVDIITNSSSELFILRSKDLDNILKDLESILDSPSDYLRKMGYVYDSSTCNKEDDIYDIALDILDELDPNLDYDNIDIRRQRLRELIGEEIVLNIIEDLKKIQESHNNCPFEELEDIVLSEGRENETWRETPLYQIAKKNGLLDQKDVVFAMIDNRDEKVLDTFREHYKSNNSIIWDRC